MNDHSDTIQYLDHKLGVGPNDFEMNPAASDAPRRKVSINYYSDTSIRTIN